MFDLKQLFVSFEILNFFGKFLSKLVDKSYIFASVYCNKKIPDNMKILMLLPMFLQTDAFDDSLIDLRSGPPGFLNDPIFTPSNAS